jgi:CheY-like chemotaxis protein
VGSFSRNRPTTVSDLNTANASSSRERQTVPSALIPANHADVHLDLRRQTWVIHRTVDADERKLRDRPASWMASVHLRSGELMPIKILCADDDDDLREFIELACQRDPEFAVTTVRTGEQVLASARDGHFDLILLDVVMPNLDGPETLLRLRAQEESRETPVVFLTAHNHPSELDWLRTFDVIDILPKPVDIETLASELRSLTERSRHG